MPSASTIAAVAVASVALAAIPGPAVVYIISRSVHEGRKAAVVSAFGLNVGIIAHAVAAVAGLAAVVAASDLAFNAIKFAGAAYLVALGLRTLVEHRKAARADAEPRGSLWRTFRRGVVVNLLNPKIALFFLAFLPQFVDRARPETPQLGVLAATFVVCAMACDTAWALASGTVAGLLGESPRIERARRVGSASVLIALGVAAAFAGR